RGARLHTARLALLRARDRERPAHVEEFALVVERVPPFGVVEAPLRLVEQKGIVVPAVPGPARGVRELAGAPIALVLRKVLLVADIGCFGGIGRGHHIPARPSAADEIERGKAART